MSQPLIISDTCPFLLLVSRDIGSCKIHQTLVRTLGPQFGSATAVKAIRRKTLDVSQFAAIFSFLGRNDLDLAFKEPSEGALELINTVHRFNPRTLVFLAGPIPQSSDNRSAVAKCVNSGKAVEALAEARSDVFFSKIAQDFYTKDGVKADMFQDQVLSAKARQLITMNVISRIKLLLESNLL